MAHLFDPGNVARLHDPARKSFQDPAKLFPLIRPYGQGDSAEIGCGSGYFTVPLATFLKGRGFCYAFDLQEAMLDLLRKEINTTGPDPGIRPILCTDDTLGIPDGSIELAWMVNAFHELRNPGGMIGEIFRVLSPGGQLFVVDWKKEETPQGPPISERASEVSLYDLLILAGFNRIRSHDLYPFHYVVEVLKD